MKPRDLKRQKNLQKKRQVRENKEKVTDDFAFNYLITLEYDGHDIGGYAKQKHKNTVQNRLEDALEEILGRSIKTIESSRTDAKVHARDQKVMFKYYKQIDIDKLKESLNNMMDNRINVLSIRNVDKDFHCRYDVKNKTYYYYITKKYSVFTRNYKYYHNRNLNVDVMRKACTYLVGEHDFTSFCSARATQDSKVRTINSIDISETKEDIIIKINGNGFLYNMVRIIVGTLIEFSDKKVAANEIRNVLEAMDRTKAGATAPAYGLYLHEIKY